MGTMKNQSRSQRTQQTKTGLGSLRLISGNLRGRRIVVPEGPVRPLLSRLRKSLADILRPRLPGARVLDLFGGSGAIAFELVSNGAASAVISEKDPSVAALISQNAATLGVEVEMLNIDALDAVKILAARGDVFDVIIAAPPYRLGLQQKIMEMLEEYPGLLSPDGLLFIQREAKEPEPVPARNFVHASTRSYGRTRFDFFDRISD